MPGLRQPNSCSPCRLVRAASRVEAAHGAPAGQRVSLQPRPGFEWGRVTWGRPDERVSTLCSYCGQAISEDAMPLILWTKDGYCARFCEDCQSTLWGLE